MQISAIPDTLFEAQMFGHEAGAFTDARAARPGWFEAAHGGTLFLDEIGELSPSAQARLLRVLEDAYVTRLGSTTRRPVDVRIVAATNRDLAAAAEAREFREDLLHRLMGATIELPPLRARGDDLDRLVAFFLPRLAAGTGGVPEITAAARQVMARYAWSGNVRELQNVLRDALVAAVPGVIDVEHLPEHVRCFDAHVRLPDLILPPGVSLAEAKAAFEVRCIQQALSECGGNYTAAAQRLGIDRKTIRLKLRARAS